MAIPAYLWLKDDGGADLRGSVDVVGREGSIEIHGLRHGVSIPTDDTTGKAPATCWRIMSIGGTLEVVR